MTSATDWSDVASVDPTGDPVMRSPDRPSRASRGNNARPTPRSTS